MTDAEMKVIREVLKIPQLSPEGACNLIQKFCEIDARKRGLETESRDEHNRHAEAVNYLKAKRAALIKDCPHPSTMSSYQPHPAGGSDSCTTCSLCGGQW